MVIGHLRKISVGGVMASTDFFIKVQPEIRFCKPHLCLLSLKTLENPNKRYTNFLRAFVYSVFMYCFVHCFSFCIYLSLPYFCTSALTAAIGWKPNCSKQISHHIKRSLHKCIVTGHYRQPFDTLCAILQYTLILSYTKL